MQGESVSVLVLELVKVALEVTGEFVRFGVTEFGFFGTIIGIVELISNSICEIGKARLSLYGKTES